MYIVYHPTNGWALKLAPEDEDHYVGSLQGDYKPWNPELFTDLELRLIKLRGSDCLVWGGTIHGCSARTNAIPYYVVSRYSGIAGGRWSTTRWGARFPKQFPARQLIIAKYLNFSYMLLPRIKLGINCETPGCANINHIIPFNYYARTKMGAVAVTPEVVVPERKMSEEEKERVRRSVLGAIDQPIKATNSTKAIQDILPKGGRRAEDFTPEENAEIEKAQAKKKDAPASLDNIDMPTTRGQK
jgi:hypothetical protein